MSMFRIEPKDHDEIQPGEYYPCSPQRARAVLSREGFSFRSLPSCGAETILKRPSVNVELDSGEHFSISHTVSLIKCNGNYEVRCY